MKISSEYKRMKGGVLGFLIALLLVTNASTVLCQPLRVHPRVQVIGSPTEKSVRLRWAPSTPALWHLANQHGYTVERITLVAENKVLPKTERKVLNAMPLKPVPLPRWEEATDSSDYAAVAAQAIFGKSFDLTNNVQSPIMTAVAKSRELEARFSYALFSADQSPEVAKLSGLYWEDETIVIGSRYLYRVYVNVPIELMAADTGFVFMGLSDYRPLPQPLDFQAEFGEKTVSLSWNGAMLKSIYNSYWIEKSLDGKQFHATTSKPVINTFSNAEDQVDRYFAIDTLAASNQKYFYRIRGNTSFGDVGPASDTISGFSIPEFRSVPSIVKAELTREGHANVEWTIDEQATQLLKSFDLLRQIPRTNESEIVVGGLAPTARNVLDSLPTSTNYYVVRANDRWGRTVSSFAHLLQKLDSIGPAAPDGLTGVIDSAGIVTLGWKPGGEPDLYGYEIFRSNFRGEEFIRLPGPMVRSGAFVDTIGLRNLTGKIFYKVRALDTRFNASAFSSVLAIVKPDITPPVQPAFTSIRGDSLGLHLEWSASSSMDVATYELYRRGGDKEDWTQLKKIPPSIDKYAYLDSTVEHGVKYSYTLLAVDSSGLESKPAIPVGQVWQSTNPYPVIREFYSSVSQAKREIHLVWKYPLFRVGQFLLYKSINDGPFKLYRTLDGSRSEYSDPLEGVVKDVGYFIVASFADGFRSKPSKVIIVSP